MNGPNLKLEEPTGLGAVVMDAEGEQYVLVNGGPGGCWVKRGHGLTGYGWGEVPAVSVLSEGWSALSTRFGWCASSKHEACIRQYHSLVNGALRTCNCECHAPTEPQPRKKGW